MLSVFINLRHSLLGWGGFLAVLRYIIPSLLKVEPFVINEDQVRCSAEEAVVADPLISRHLREHQKEGVRFMYSRLKVHFSAEFGCISSTFFTAFLWRVEAF